MEPCGSCDKCQVNKAENNVHDMLSHPNNQSSASKEYNTVVG